MSKIRSMRSEHVEFIVQVHMDAFRGFFLTFLGPAFLKQFYAGVCEDGSGIALVYEDGSILGFVVGTVQTSGFYKRLIQKRWWRFGLASMSALLRKPSIVPRLLRALTLPGDVSNQQQKIGTLMSLAVRSDCQGQGIGKQLVASFLEESRKRGVEFVDLTTDAVDNDVTNEFYLKLGFTRARIFATPEGRLMNEYVIQVT